MSPQSNMQTYCMELLHKLMALDFTILDLVLFLDTHPHCREALAKYNELAAQAIEMRQEYEQKCAMLTNVTGSPYPWQWPEDPWPWQGAYYTAPREEA